MTPLIQAGMFLIDTVFTFFILSVILRVLFEAIHADFYNPVSQMILKATNFLLLPVRRIVPPYKNMDYASVVLVLILAFFKQGLLILLSAGKWGSPFGLLLLGIADVVNLLFYIYLFALIAVTAGNWLNIAGNPLLQIAAQLINPLLNRIRAYLPTSAGFDFSPLILAVVLILIDLLVIQFIAHLGINLLISA
ncbi:MAG: YggT family protein [Gammaproteobacteria bacterium]|jgi:YggT family protein